MGLRNKIFWLFSTLGISQGYAFDVQIFPSAPQSQKTSLRYSGMIQPRSDYKVTSSEAGLHRESLMLAVPVYRSEKSAWSLIHAFQYVDLYPNQDQGQIAIGDLYSIQFGVSHTRALNEGRLLSFTGTFGSASDKPFKDSEVNTIGGTAVYSVPGEKKSWIFLLNYSNNRPILNGLPLPGFAYIHTPSPRFRGTFGAPFASIYWKFADRWSLNAFTLVPWVLRASVAYSIVGPVQAVAGADFSQLTFLKHGRAIKEDRLYYDEKKVYLGLRSPLSRVLFADLDVGYSFDRSFFSADSYSPNPSGAIELGASPYLRLGIAAAF